MENHCSVFRNDEVLTEGVEKVEQIAERFKQVRIDDHSSVFNTARVEALELENRHAEARSVRLDSIGWARYGFGPDWAVRAKLREIASLNPLKG